MDKAPEKQSKKKKLTLTPSQRAAMDKFNEFIADKDAKVFILKGYAGTGKTTLVTKFLEKLETDQCSFSLLASTGRAAKILANTTQRETRTVHSQIYKFTNLSQDLDKLSEKTDLLKVDSTGQLLLNFDLTPINNDEFNITHYYIVDEASMISDKRDFNTTQAEFGSGELLSDLLKYDSAGKFIFVGDVCQLPPVLQNFSPALEAEYIKSKFGIVAYECELNEIMRQSEGNDIVYSAEKLRELYYHPQTFKWAKFPLKGYRNIHVLDNQIEMVRLYVETIKKHGFNTASMICYSNKQSSQTTQLIRPSLGHHSVDLEEGDLLLVTQNNLLTGLMNGDLVTVVEIGGTIKRANLTFLKVKVRELFTGIEYSQLMIAEVLYSNATNISHYQQRDLLIDYYYRMKAKGVKQQSPFFRDYMMKDPYLNALRAVYGYVLTCHKSQGGEWDTVFLDIPKHLPIQEKPMVYQWVYTAMTRAKKDLYIVHDFWLM